MPEIKPVSQMASVSIKIKNGIAKKWNIIFIEIRSNEMLLARYARGEIQVNVRVYRPGNRKSPSIREVNIFPADICLPRALLGKLIHIGRCGQMREQ